jgi:hypothetical protein
MFGLPVALKSPTGVWRGGIRAGSNFGRTRYRLEIVDRRVKGDMLSQSDGAYDVGPAHDAHHLLAVVHDWQPLDVVSGHHARDLFNGSFFAHADDLLAHDGFDVFALLSDDVGLGDDPYDFPDFVCHRRPADLIFDQRHRQTFDRHRRIYRDDVSRHNVLGNHEASLLQLSLGHQSREITDTAAIAPFVVVPGNNFCHFPL